MGPRPAEPAGPQRVSGGSRAVVLEALERHPGPSTLATLSQATGLHANTLREHLEALEGQGRVQRRQAAPSGRGRPAGLYELVAAHEPGGRKVVTGGGDYAALASTLASAVARSSDDPGAEGVRAGREWGRALAAGQPPTGRVTGAAARRQVVGLLADLGFAPVPSQRDAVVRLTRCPLLEAARHHPDVVCGVHRGLVEGALHEWGATQSVELRPFSEPGACRLHMTADRTATA